MTRLSFILLAAAILATATNSPAAEPPTSAVICDGKLNFQPGTAWFGTSLSYIDGLGKPADIGALSFSADYFVLKNFSIGAELTGLGASQPGEAACGASFSGSLRHHILQWQKQTVFIDAFFGPVETDARIPEGGTRFNFITRVGPGMLFKTGEDQFVLTGLRYWHLSNAQIHGVARNPAINGIQFYIELVHQW